MRERSQGDDNGSCLLRGIGLVLELGLKSFGVDILSSAVKWLANRLEPSTPPTLRLKTRQLRGGKFH